MMQERREHKRILFNREVYLTFTDDRSVGCMAHDFSMRGIGLLSDEAITTDTVIWVEFTTLGAEQRREINLRGRVIYSASEGGQYKIGVSFY